MSQMRVETLPHASRPEWAAGIRQRLVALRIPLALAGILVLGAVLRLWGLGDKSLWFDEAYSVYLAQQPFVEIPRLLRLYDTHPPLHYVLLHFWMAAFGKAEVAIRLPSVLASVGVLALTFAFARRLAGASAALLATLLLALSPFQIVAAREARMYPFLTFFGLSAFYSLWLALEENRRWYWAVYVGSMILAIYSHHFAWLLLLAQGLYVLLIHRDRAAARRWIAAAAVIGVAFALISPAFLTQLRTGRGWPDVRPPFGLGALTDLLGLISFGGAAFGMGTYFRRGALPLEFRPAILLPFLLLMAAGVASLTTWRRRAFAVCYGLVPIIAVSLTSLRWNIFYERYFSFVLPPFVLLLAVGILYVVDSMWPTVRGAALAGLLSLIAAFMLPVLAEVYRAPTTYDWRAAASHVESHARAEDFVLYIPAFARIPFEYYFRGTQKRMSINPREVIAARKVSFKTPVDKQRMAEIAQAHPRMWIVATIPVGYEARKELAARLAPYFREADGKSFGLVYVFLWESRLFGTRPR